MIGSQITNKINHSLNIGNQVASVSHSNLLNSRVEFVASDAEHLMTVHALQSKYHQLGTAQEQTNRLNGQYKLSPTKIAKALQHPESHVVGKEENGMPVPRVVLFSPCKVQLEWKQSSRIGAGLVNLGNTCFMNTVIQCLTYCTPLANYLLHEEEHMHKCKLTGFCMLCEMQKHMKWALDRHGQAIRPSNIYHKLKSIAKHFQFGRQEDAHEFLRYVIDNLWKSCLSTHDGGFRLDPASKETTVVNQIFGGYNRSQVVCLRCHGKSNTFDHFMDLILDIKNVSSLQSALEKFVQAEVLEDDNAYKCPKCGTKVRAEKKFTVHKPPNVATFQFKRFDYNRMFGGKITKSISYPEKLDLRPFMSETEGPSVMYKLNSVLVHMGNTCNSGHYYCFVRNSNGCWYLMDDTRVHQVSLDHVLQQQAYVLFYLRVHSHQQDCLKKSIYSVSTSSSAKVETHVKNGNDAALSRTPLATRPNSLLRNGSCNKEGTLKLCRSPGTGQHLREKISFGIRRPSTPSTATNGPQKQKPSPNNAKTLVPYGGDSSESSDEEKSARTVSNGIPQNRTLSTLATLPRPESAASSEVFEHPNGKCERSPLPKIGIGTTSFRAKATASWHVIDSNLQSPSVASGSSNNSINSTTDWSVVDQESAGKGKDRAFDGWSVPTSKDNGNVDKTFEHTSVLENVSDGRLQTPSFVNGDISVNGEVHGAEEVADRGAVTGINSSASFVNDGENREVQKKEHQFGGRRVEERKRTWTHPPEGHSWGHKRYRDNRYGKGSTWEHGGGWGMNRMDRKPNFYKNGGFRREDDRRRNDSGTSNSSYEMEWIERTKETVEEEKHSGPERFWEKNVRSGHRSDQGQYRHNGGRWDGSRHSDAADELLQMSSQGYGNGVCTWDGGRSWMNQEPIRKRNFSDDYDDEYDRGKIRRERKRQSDPYFTNSNGNPFQRFQDAKSNRRPYGGFNSFQQKHYRWNHSQDRYHGNRNYCGFPPRHHNNRYHHR